ncbi:MAG: TIGR01212 family radical SAM protein [Planctomycetaceae bacterium]|nr:TIGR01212 family radical SAM protein [Planctomycetaceae bacterium]
MTRTSTEYLNEPAFDWRQAGFRYYSYNFDLRCRFGHRVQRVSVDAGFTCPNVDGKVAIGGCNFCYNRSFSPSRRLSRQSLLKQIDAGILRLKQRYKCDHFMAYFQPATNTYAPVEQLRQLYDDALSHPQVVALAVGTRPDCVADEVLDLLQEFSERTYVSVEYGMQTVHNRSLDWMNRGHHHDATVDAMRRSDSRGFQKCLHVILGLPGESHQDMLETAHEVAHLAPDAVKLHNLYAVKNTLFGEKVIQGEYDLMGRDEYVRTLVDFLEILPPDIVVERISGEAPPAYFIGPSWCLDKPAVLRAVDKELETRDSWQGKHSKR